MTASASTSSTSALPAVTSPPPSASAAPKMVYARVKFSRKAGSSTEVDITAGETVSVLNQAGEWWYGTTLNGGKAGYFPGNYVEIRDDLDPAKARAPIVTSSAPSSIPVEAEKQARIVVENTTPVQTASASELTKKSRANAPVMRRQTMASKPAIASLRGENFAFQAASGEDRASPTWYQPWFLDFFAAGYKQKIVENDSYLQKPAVLRALQSFIAMKTILTRAKEEACYFPDQEMQQACAHIQKVFNEAVDLTEQLPAHSNDSVRFFLFSRF